MKRAILSASHSNHQLTELASRLVKDDSASCHNCPPSITIVAFRGQDDYISASDWIDIYDAIATDHNYTSANKIIRLGGHLRRYALSWYVEEMKRHDGDLKDSNWYDLKESFKKHFILCNLIAQSSDASSAVSSYTG